MCGISGFIGHKVNIEKMKILGIINDSRGKHSCGIFYDDNIVKGIDKEARMPDLLARTVLPEREAGLMLMHSRLSTYGTHTKINAHPIIINAVKSTLSVQTEDPTRAKIIGVHNGKIDNWESMRKKYDLPLSDFDLDTKVLFGAILKAKTFEEPLTFYEGAASIMFTLDKKSLFVFRGETGGVEERPLFYLREPEGYYFSSTLEALAIIQTRNGELVEEVPPNVLLKYTYLPNAEDENDFLIEEVAKVTRVKPVIPPRPKSNNFQSTLPATPSKEDTICFYALRRTDEQTPNKKYGDILFKNFRYVREITGAPLNGKFFISDDGKIEREQKEHTKPYYFYEGMLMDEQSYVDTIYAMLESLDDVFDKLSHLSRYPIISKSAHDLYRNTVAHEKIFYRGKEFSGSILPLWCDYFYIVEKGIIVGKSERKPLSDEQANLTRPDQVYLKHKAGKAKEQLKDYHNPSGALTTLNSKNSRTVFNATIKVPEKPSTTPESTNNPDLEVKTSEEEALSAYENEISNKNVATADWPLIQKSAQDAISDDDNDLPAKVETIIDEMLEDDDPMAEAKEALLSAIEAYEGDESGDPIIEEKLASLRLAYAKLEKDTIQL